MARAASRSFPLLLMAALGLPLAGVVSAPLFEKDITIWMYMISAITELVAVPVAIFYLLRGGYVTIGNVLLTLVAAVPAAFLVFFLYTLQFGHFHI